MSAEDHMSALAEQLHSIAEQLSDLAMDQIRAALDPDGDESPGAGSSGRKGGAGDPVQLERRLVRARRAVEKAAVILSRGPEQDPGDDGP